MYLHPSIRRALTIHTRRLPARPQTPHQTHHFSTTHTPRAAYNMPHSPKITSVDALPASEAKWLEFQKLSWTDQTGKPRIWEAASRKTRGSSGVDAVAIAALITHPSRAPSTIVILQYRPPVDAVCVEFPAGLVDEGETPEQAAIRELKEETGYEGKDVELSPVIVSDPGMSTANMQLAIVRVELKEGDEEPEQALEEGEFIERVVVPVGELYERLEGFAREGKSVDARLWHWAGGMRMARMMGGK